MSINISEWKYILSCLEQPTPIVYFPAYLPMIQSARINNNHVWVQISNTGEKLYDNRVFRGIVDIVGTNENSPTIWDSEAPRMSIVLNGVKFVKPMSNGTITIVDSRTTQETNMKNIDSDTTIKDEHLLQPVETQLENFKPIIKKKPEAENTTTTSQPVFKKEEFQHNATKKNKKWMEKSSLDNGTIAGVGASLLLGLIVCILLTNKN